MESGPQYITDEHKSYSPRQLDEFIIIPNGEYQRLIFSEPIQLKPEEVEKWKQFLKLIEGSKLDPLPPYYLDF